MNKQTSSTVSSVAGKILGLSMRTIDNGTSPADPGYNDLLHDAKILAGSALSQDETKGQSGTGIHPAPAEFSEAQITADPILQFFGYTHLPPHLASTSVKFFYLALYIIGALPRSAERTVSLRKLLEAKDAAVRANLPAPKTGSDMPVASGEGLRRLGEPVEVGGHSEDTDGPLSFGG